MSQSARMSQCKKIIKRLESSVRELLLEKKYISSQWKNDGNSAEVLLSDRMVMATVTEETVSFT